MLQNGTFTIKDSGQRSLIFFYIPSSLSLHFISSSRLSLSFFGSNLKCCASVKMLLLRFLKMYWAQRSKIIAIYMNLFYSQLINHWIEYNIQAVISLRNRGHRKGNLRGKKLIGNYLSIHHYSTTFHLIKEKYKTSLSSRKIM